MMMVVMFILFVMVFVSVVVLDGINPCGRGGHAVEVEEMGMKDAVEVHVAIVAFHNLGFGLQGTQDFAGMGKFFGRNLRSLVQKDDVAEFNLLDNEVFDIVFRQVSAKEFVAAVEFVLQAQGIHHGDNTVELRETVFLPLGHHLRHGLDGLCNGTGFADAAGLDDDVVERMLGDNLVELGNEVHLQRTADAAVLKCHKRIVVLANDASLGNEVGIDVHLADVVDNDGKTDAAAV